MLIAASVFAGDSGEASICSSVHQLGMAQVVMLLQRHLWKTLLVLLLTLKSSVGSAQSDPTPAPQRNFMIFFKWNSAELTTRDKETIAQAAMHAKRLIDRQGTVSVRGYVDTSLSQQRSSTLSERMARVVRDELIRDGIAPAVITYVGVGKAQLLKETGEGVREPLNRRVEIRIQ